MLIEQITEHVTFVRTELVNWVLVRDESGLVLVDAGYPLQRDLVERSIRQIGQDPSDLRAVLVTHAHLDHVGAIPWLVREHGVPVLSSAREAAHLRGDFTESIGLLDVVANIWRPRFARWFFRALPQLGGIRRLTIPTAQAFPAPGRLPLPRGPLPIPTSGHTSGHVGYFLPDDGVLITGDALVSAHPSALPVVGAQVLPGWFQLDEELVLDTLDEFAEVDAAIVLPGHGPSLQGSIAALVAEARDRSSRWPEVDGSPLAPAQLQFRPEG